MEHNGWNYCVYITDHILTWPLFSFFLVKAPIIIVVSPNRFHIKYHLTNRHDMKYSYLFLKGERAVRLKPCPGLLVMLLLGILSVHHLQLLPILTRKEMSMFLINILFLMRDISCNIPIFGSTLHSPCPAARWWRWWW